MAKKQKPTKALTQEEMVELKSEIQDLLNKALVKMQNVPDVPHESDEDGRVIYGTPIEDEDEGGYKMDDDYNYITVESKELVYLASVKAALEEITEDGAASMLEKFYNSSCY